MYNFSHQWNISRFWSNVRTYFFIKILWNNSADLFRDLRQQLSIFEVVSILKSNYSRRLPWLQLCHPTNRFVWLIIYPWKTITHESSPICCLTWKSYMTCLCYMIYLSAINKPREHEPYPVVNAQTPRGKTIRTDAGAMSVRTWNRHKYSCSL